MHGRIEKDLRPQRTLPWGPSRQDRVLSSVYLSISSGGKDASYLIQKAGDVGFPANLNIIRCAADHGVAGPEVIAHVQDRPGFLQPPSKVQHCQVPADASEPDQLHQQVTMSPSMSLQPTAGSVHGELSSE